MLFLGLDGRCATLQVGEIKNNLEIGYYHVFIIEPI